MPGGYREGKRVCLGNHHQHGGQLFYPKTHAQLEALLGRPVPRDRVLMAGDFLRSDIQGARDFRYRSALLLTGVTTLDMLERSPVRPDLGFETLG